MKDASNLTAKAMRHRKPALRAIYAVSLAVYLAAAVMAALPVARLAALAFAAAAAADVADDPLLPRPRGTAMVAMAAFALPLEGLAQAMATGMTQTAFVEIGIGVYLFAALLQMVRR